MENERVICANSMDIALNGFQGAIEKYGAQFGHEVVAAVKTKAELKEVIGSADATVLLLDPEFPDLSEGIQVVLAVRKLRPDIKIITISRIEGLKLGDVNFQEMVNVEDLMEALNNLRH